MTKREFMKELKMAAKKMGLVPDFSTGTAVIGDARIHCFEETFALWMETVSISFPYENVTWVARFGTEIHIGNGLPYLYVNTKKGVAL